MLVIMAVVERRVVVGWKRSSWMHIMTGCVTWRGLHRSVYSAASLPAAHRSLMLLSVVVLCGLVGLQLSPKQCQLALATSCQSNLMMAIWLLGIRTATPGIIDDDCQHLVHLKRPKTIRMQKKNIYTERPKSLSDPVFLGPPRVFTPNTILICLAVFAQQSRVEPRNRQTPWTSVTTVCI